MTVTRRELSWICPGTLLAVTIDGHRYSGHAVEPAGPDRWKVSLLTWGGAEAGYRYLPGGICELGRDGENRIEHLLGPPYARTNGDPTP